MTGAPVYCAQIERRKANFLANSPISVLSENVPAVSILIDTCNHERFIEKAINSVLEQEFPVPEREIIVVDDGSTDRTSQIVQQFEPSLRELYAQHDIFVLPSLVEGMPLVLLEAMASGLAVVTTESSGMTDLVAISSLYGDSQLRYKLGCAAQEKMKRCTWKLSALRQEAVFRRAMGVKPVPKVPEPQETNIDGASYSGKVV